MYGRTGDHIHIPMDLMPEVIRSLVIAGRDYCRETVPVSRTLTRPVARLREGDIVALKRRGGREGPTPYLMSRRGGTEVTTATIAVKRLPDSGHHIVLSCYAGGPTPREPWDRAIRDAREYWEAVDHWNHYALTECPGPCDPEELFCYHEGQDIAPAWWLRF